MNLLHIPRGIAGIAVIGDIGLGPGVLSLLTDEVFEPRESEPHSYVRNARR